MILSFLDGDALMEQASRRDYPKWWSLCLLRLAGLKTLNAAFIPAVADYPTLVQAVRAFAHAIGQDAVLVRSDGGVESTSYRRGGLTYPVAEAVVAADEFLREGRAVILLEPTNRFSNRLSINATLDVSGAWAAEGLGCGFDTSDLQRGFVAPQWIWSASASSFEQKASGGRSILRRELSDVPHDVRVHARLDSLVDLFHGQGRVMTQSQIVEMLVTTGNTCLFTEDPPPSSRIVRQVFDAAWSISRYLRGSEFPFTIAYAILADGRDIFWDLTIGSLKWTSASRGSRTESATTSD
ncbi:MAG: hypothetical protein E7812_05680 [Phenylobacterium sp.]|nr:MAG: hypothetical protein E7812_05680 [Phenylobacterium sp.]